MNADPHQKLRQHLEARRALRANVATLEAAASSGDIPAIESLIEQGVDIGAVGGEALINAATNGHTDVVALLLAHDGDIRASDEAAFRKATECGHTAIVAMLIDRGARVRLHVNFALRRAADNGHTETVALLLSRGAEIHAEDDSALRWAAYNGHADTVAVLLNPPAGEPADGIAVLRWMATSAYMEPPILLLDQGVDCTKDASLLSVAATHGRTDLLKLFEARGADLRASDEVALRRASGYGHMATVTYLLSRGADPLVAPPGKQNAKQLATNQGRADVAAVIDAYLLNQELLSRGAIEAAHKTSVQCDGAMHPPTAPTSAIRTPRL